MKRKGSWIQTYTGRAFWPMDPHEDDICLEDIAHSLSHQCRFAGHSSHFYSVAQHSVLVAGLVPKKHALWGLLHDASEAYLVDLPRPIKNAGSLGRSYKRAEARVMAIICRKYGISKQEPTCIKDADDRILATEARDLMSAQPYAWEQARKPLDMFIVPQSPEEAKREFLNLAYVLINKTKREEYV